MSFHSSDESSGSLSPFRDEHVSDIRGSAQSPHEFSYDWHGNLESDLPPAYASQVRNGEFDYDLGLTRYQLQQDSKEAKREAISAETSKKQASLDERTAQILERTRASGSSVNTKEAQDEPDTDWTRTWEDIMGIPLPSGDTKQTHGGDSPKSDERSKHLDHIPLETSNPASPVDSLDISPDDLEVGAIAARKRKELQTQRLSDYSTGSRNATSAALRTFGRIPSFGQTFTSGNSDDNALAQFGSVANRESAYQYAMDCDSAQNSPQPSQITLDHKHFYESDGKCDSYYDSEVVAEQNTDETTGKQNRVASLSLPSKTISSQERSSNLDDIRRRWLEQPGPLFSAVTASQTREEHSSITANDDHASSLAATGDPIVTMHVSDSKAIEMELETEVAATVLQADIISTRPESRMDGVLDAGVETLLDAHALNFVEQQHAVVEESCTVNIVPVLERCHTVLGHNEVQESQTLQPKILDLEHHLLLFENTAETSSPPPSPPQDMRGTAFHGAEFGATYTEESVELILPAPSSPVGSVPLPPATANTNSDSSIHVRAATQPKAAVKPNALTYAAHSVVQSSLSMQEDRSGQAFVEDVIAQAVGPSQKQTPRTQDPQTIRTRHSLSATQTRTKNRQWNEHEATNMSTLQSRSFIVPVTVPTEDALLAQIAQFQSHALASIKRRSAYKQIELRGQGSRRDLAPRRTSTRKRTRILPHSAETPKKSQNEDSSPRALVVSGERMPHTNHSLQRSWDQRQVLHATRSPQPKGHRPAIADANASRKRVTKPFNPRQRGTDTTETRMRSRARNDDRSRVSSAVYEQKVEHQGTCVDSTGVAIADLLVAYRPLTDEQAHPEQQERTVEAKELSTGIREDLEKPSDDGARNIQSRATQPNADVDERDELLRLLEAYKVELNVAHERLRLVSQLPANTTPPTNAYQIYAGLVADETKETVQHSASAADGEKIPNACVNTLKRVLHEYAQQRRSEAQTNPTKTCRNAEWNPSPQDLISVDRSTLEQIVKELQLQEALIFGFQAENEKMHTELKALMKTLGTERKAFAEERQVRIAQIMRMENEARSQTRLSHSELRNELQDQAVRHSMEDRFADREQDLKIEIDKLRSEQKHLEKQLKAETERVSVVATQNDAALEDLRRKHGQEVALLRSKLAWYTENQELLQQKDEQLEQQQQELKKLRSALRAQRADGVTRQHEDLIDHTGDKTRSTPFRPSGRNPADVKRIKELENQLRELEESLRKRHPDSIAALIRAQTDEAMQAELQKKASRVQQLEHELAQTQTESDVKLRGLRQEHEKTKLWYEEKIRVLGEERRRSGGLSGAAAASRQTDALRNAPPFKEATPDPEVDTGPVQNTTLEEARERSAYLTLETQRIRKFYVQKMEKMKLKHAAVVRALRRGSSTDIEGNSRAGDDEKAYTAALETRVAELEAQVMGAAAYTLPHENIKAEYEKRIAMLEQELLTTAAALGSMQAVQAHSAALAPITLDRREDLIPPRYSDHRIDDLQQRLRELESERNEFMGRAIALQRQLDAQMQENIAPALAHPGIQYIALREKLVELEKRFTRREAELQRALDESKQANKVELSRLHAIHQSELMEKDRKLEAARAEIDSILATLHTLMQSTSGRGRGCTQTSSFIDNV